MSRAAHLAGPEAPPLEARLRGPSCAGLAVLAVFFLGFGCWACLAPLRSAAIAEGAVGVETKRKIVQHLEGGIVREILARDGDRVAADQVLLRLDDTKARTTLAALRTEWCEAQARRRRLAAERDGAAALEALPDDDPCTAEAFAGQRRIFEARAQLLQSRIAMIRKRADESRDEIAGLEAQRDAASRQLELIGEERAAVEPLVARGLERRTRLLALDRSIAEIAGRRGDAVARIARARQAIDGAEIETLALRDDRQNEVVNELRDTERRLTELAEQVRAAADVLARAAVRAPLEGVVTDLRVHTPGGVLAPGEPILDIVPGADRLIVEAQARPEDIDRLHAGLRAEVRLLPYSQRRVPPVPGEVVYVSADRMVDKASGKPYFAARIALDPAALAALPEVRLVPGMPAEATIETGVSTPAAYALAPLLDRAGRAFREK